MADPLELTLLRHGRSRADDEAVHEGRYDSPLTAVGEAQAEKLAAYWLAHPLGFERVVCSSLFRARRTAEIIGAALNLEVIPDDAWREFDNGLVVGLPYAEAEKRYPKLAFRGRFERFMADGGESYAAFLRRISEAFEALVQSSHTNVLIVAHGGSLNVAQRDLLRVLVQTSFAFGDTSFAEITVLRDADRVRLKTLNRTPHLENR